MCKESNDAVATGMVTIVGSALVTVQEETITPMVRGQLGSIQIIYNKRVEEKFSAPPCPHATVEHGYYIIPKVVRVYTEGDWDCADACLDCIVGIDNLKPKS